MGMNTEVAHWDGRMGVKVQDSVWKDVPSRKQLQVYYSTQAV
jgi:hypothetical protein